MKSIIEYADFEKLELRVGKVIACEEPEWSRKLLRFTVDFGPEIGQKTVLSGVRQWYNASDFEDKNFPFIVNLAERKMGEGVSQGMMLMADAEAQPILFPLPAELIPGTIIR